MYGKIHLCSNHIEAEELSRTELYDEDTGKYDGLTLYYIDNRQSIKVDSHCNEIEGTEYTYIDISRFKELTFEQKIDSVSEVLSNAVKESIEKTLEEINNGI